MKYFYERNDELLNHSVNKTVEEIVKMTYPEFNEWVVEMRDVVRTIWDTKGIPPRTGKSENGIIEDFEKLNIFDTSRMSSTDEDGDSCIINNWYYGNAVNQFFPTMMKTKINYVDPEFDTTFWSGWSIYDHFVRDDLLDKVQRFAQRNLKRDSFYNYSTKVSVGDTECISGCTDGLKWITEFEKYRDTVSFEQYDYWIQDATSKYSHIEYTGYGDIDGKHFLFIERQNLLDKLEIIPAGCLCNINVEDDTNGYFIRLYKKNNKIFPKGFIAFQVTWVQNASNFPPLVAKYIYEKYTEDIKDESIINVYDPSAGWGGRILGAMSCDDNRNINYIGTDPNMDHVVGDTTKYEEVAKYFNNKTTKGNPARSFFDDKAHTNIFEIFTSGSEMIHEVDRFKKYKGEVDLVFTSPPYYAKEVYSEDETQSAVKFGNYDLWKDGFLYPTLKTAYEWLKPDRYLIWNISNVGFGTSNTGIRTDKECIYPLEQDSIDILESFGMVLIRKEKMLLGSMPGSFRVQSGKATAINSCKVNGRWCKYEPIYVFKKLA